MSASSTRGLRRARPAGPPQFAERTARRDCGEIRRRCHLFTWTRSRIRPAHRAAMPMGAVSEPVPTSRLGWGRSASELRCSCVLASGGTRTNGCSMCSRGGTWTQVDARVGHDETTKSTLGLATMRRLLDEREPWHTICGTESGVIDTLDNCISGLDAVHDRARALFKISGPR